MGRAKCATCHVVKGNPRALGVAGPNLTNVGSRMSIAAGWLNHRVEEDGSIDPQKQYENFYKWIKETDVGITHESNRNRNTRPCHKPST